MASLAIDCGTYNTVAAMSVNGQIHIITDTNGQSSIPSVVHFGEQGEPIFGRAALKDYWKKKNIVRCAKRVMGLKMNSVDLNQYQDDCVTKIISGMDGYPRFKLTCFGDEGITPTEVISRIYREIGRKAREKTEQRIEHLIITIPAFFDQDQRLEAEKAAKEAGICENVHVVTEPVAAAYQHKLEKLPAESVVMVVDIGAGTLDICIMRQKQNGEQEVVATGGERKLGGEDITKKISDALEVKFEREHGRKLIYFPKNTTAYRTKKEALKQLAEDAKCELSEHNSSVITFNANDFIMARKMKVDSDSDDSDSDDNNEYTVDIARDEARRLAEPIMEKVEIAIKNTLRNAGMRTDDISHVVLVGGSAHFIPFQETVKRVFQNDTKVKMSDNPEEIVARGALRVLNESILTKQHRLVEQLSHSYGTLVSEGREDVYVPIIPRGTTFPTTKVFSKTFFQVPLNTGLLYPAAHVGLHVRDEMNNGKAELYNPFDLTNLDTSPNNCVTLNFTIDDNGVIYVEARQKCGNPIVMPKTYMRRALDFN